MDYTEQLNQMISELQSIINYVNDLKVAMQYLLTILIVFIIIILLFF